MKKSLNYITMRTGHEDVPDDCVLIHHIQIEEDKAKAFGDDYYKRTSTVDPYAATSVVIFIIIALYTAMKVLF